MMGQRQVVLVHEAQDMQGFATDAAKQQLLGYVNALVPTTVLVLSYKKKAPRSHAAVLKAIDDKAVLVESKPVYESKLPDWVRSFATAEGLKLNSKATCTKCWCRPEPHCQRAAKAKSEHTGSDRGNCRND